LAAPNFRAEKELTTCQSIQYCCELPFKRGKITLRYLPDDLEVDAKIFMDGNISEATDILPFNLRILVFYWCGNACACFADDLNLPDLMVAKHFSELATLLSSINQGIAKTSTCD
jgi:hypothetical protein